MNVLLAACCVDLICYSAAEAQPVFVLIIRVFIVARCQDILHFLIFTRLTSYVSRLGITWNEKLPTQLKPTITL
ncbi:hypothetical protein BpHYR1_047105 [Brachionus plicatilis]|uniref:Secreted protein n=1 Tax=Brachionus plicatilis TaxID=10195 RepID=A0A3M7Q1S2_BRAPC|nr:hypothetical protein BpHYR1_047105 [Brachionus plicatilis]